MQSLIRLGALCSVFFLVSAPVAHTRSLPPPEVPKIPTPIMLSSYTQYADVQLPGDAQVLTAYEVETSPMIGRGASVAVYDVTSSGFVPSRIISADRAESTHFQVLAPQGASELTDGMSATSYKFPFNEEGGMTETRLLIRPAKPVEADTITLILDSNVALPHMVAVRAMLPGGGSETVVAPRRLDSTRITFPRTTAWQWEIVLTHSQPLRIAEIDIHERNAAIVSRTAVRFLGDPTHDYRLYVSPERSLIVHDYIMEMPDLMSNEGVVVASLDNLVANDAYIPPDADKDEVPDMTDNCVVVANTDQEDVDDNKRGDACDDFDRDRLINSKDNCPSTPNANQRDTDEDGIGDECDQEESRFTEKHAWVPWIGIGFAALVILVLGVFALRTKPEEPTPDGSV